MATVVELLAKFRADSSQFVANIEKARVSVDAFEKATKGASSSISKDLDRVNKKSVAIGAAIGTAIGQVATQAFYKAGHAAKQFLVDSIGNASDLNESMTKTEAIFGSATGTVVSFAEGAAGSLGQSNQAALDAAATFGIYGRAAGLSGEALADFAMAQTKLSSDLASFYNASPEEAANALAAALRGQNEPARRFGVLLDDMSLKAAALKMGIISSTKDALTPQNKVLAANALIMEQTSVAQGDFAKTAGGLANQQRILAAQVENAKTKFGQALLPAVLAVTGAFNTSLIPAFTKLAENFKVVIDQVSQRLAPVFVNLQEIFTNVFTALQPVIEAVGVALAVAFAVTVKAVEIFSNVIAGVTGFLADNQAIMIVAASAAGLLASGLIGLTIAFKLKTIAVKVATTAIKLFQVAQVIARGGTLASIAATNGFAASMLRLNMAMKANPIGFVIGLVMALVAGLIYAWKKSETFRKVVAKAFEMVANVVLFVVKGVIGYIKMMVNAWLSVAGFILKGAAKAFGWLPGIGDKIRGASEGFEDLKDGVNKTFDGIIKGAEGMKDKVVGAVNSAATAKAAVKPKAKPKDKTYTDSPVGAAVIDTTATEGAKKAINDMKTVVQNYNDFINNDFVPGFMKGSETARDTIMKGLDELKKVFDEKAKELKGAALTKLKDAFDTANSVIRAYIPEAMLVAGQLDTVTKELDDATKRLEEAIKERAAAQKKFGEILAQPFGEPSKITKALASSESTVESIISMYDELVSAIDQRFTDLAPGARDAVKDYLYAQTNGLIDAARMRVKAIKVLEAAQQRLDDLIGEQKQFSKSLTGSLKSFATAIADLSKTDGQATYTVIKTATGMVITQLKKSTSGVDTITKQLKERLTTIAAFANNANKLLASGLNRDYVRQLLEAGPEAAGQAVAALASANASQIAEINSLYGQIGTISDEFGVVITDKMYAEAVAMATAFRDGAALGVELINAAMTDIVSNISAILSVLGNTGLTNAADLVNALIAEFTRQANQTVGPATQIVVDKIKTTLSVLGAVGLNNAQAFMNGLIGALTGKDNLSNVNLSATAIKTNIDTIMKLLAPEALTSGLGLINSLVTAFGGANLTLVTTSATAVKDSITTALAALKTLGTAVATDLAQGLFDKLTSEKARLVALAASIAAAISAAMAGAAASIGVIVDGASDDIAELNAQVAAAANAAAKVTGGAATGGAATGGAGGGKTAAQIAAEKLASDIKNNVPRYDKQGRSLVPGSKEYAAGTSVRPNFDKLYPKPDPLKPLGTYFNTGATQTATVKTPVIIKPPAPPVKPVIKPLGNYSMSTSGSGNQGTNATVNISTTKPVTSTFVATTLANKLSKLTGAKK